MPDSKKIIADQTIVAQMRADGRQAIGLILEKYGDALYGVVLKITGSREVSEDLMQEAFLKIWKNANSYDERKGRLFTWLINIVRNTAIDKVRTQKFQRNRKSVPVEKTVYENESLSEEMNIADVGLQRAINNLEPKYRQIIDLLYLRGYTQREVTEEFDIPLGTVKTRVKIAIRELRKVLTDKELMWIILIATLAFFNETYSHIENIV